MLQGNRPGFGESVQLLVLIQGLQHAYDFSLLTATPPIKNRLKPANHCLEELKSLIY